VQEFNESNYGNEQLTIEEKLNELTARIGEKISIRRFEILEAGNGEFVSGYTHANKRVAAIALFKGNNEHDVVKNIMMNIVANNPVAVDKEHLDEK
jgi:elongation factor Ts